MDQIKAIGATASRNGLTAAQKTTAYGSLRDLRDRWGVVELHHGDCVGGDDELATMAAGLGYRTLAHPPIADHLRAYHASDVIYPPKDYLPRDRDIVDAVGALLGFPSTEVETQRSGTWYTIRYARRKGRKLLVTGPQGDLLEVVGFGYEHGEAG